MDNQTLRPDVFAILCRAASAIGEAARLEGVKRGDDLVLHAFLNSREFSVGEMWKLIDAYAGM